MAGEIKLAIVLSAMMRGSEAFDKAGGGIKGIAAAIKSALPMLAMFAAQAAFSFLKDSLNAFEDFQQVMANAGSIIGKDAQEMKEFSDQVREMSLRLPKTSKDLGTALYDILRSGIKDTAEAMNVLELSAMAASAGITDTTTASKAGIETMNAFGLEASDLTHIFDVQFLAIKFGMLRYEELAGVIGTVAPAAKASGQSLETVFAALSLMTTKGMDASAAASGLARAMEGLTKPEAIKAAAELGISFMTMSEDSARAQTEFLDQKRALDSLTNSYASTELQVKSLGEAMDKVSLEEAKNRLEISKIKRSAEKEGRDLTDAELSQISALESSNADLSLQYDELSVSQQEARIQSTDLSNQMAAQKIKTDEASKAFDDQIAATSNFLSLTDIIQQVSDKYGMLEEAAKMDIVRQLFPDVRARRAIMTIMGDEEALMGMTDAMMTQSGAMAEAFTVNTNTAAAGDQLLKNATEDLKIEIGESLHPAMEEWETLMRETICPLIKDAFIPILNALMPILKFFVEIIGAIAGVFGKYPELLWAIIGAIIAWKVAQIALNFAMSANPIGLIILAIAGLILLIVEIIKHFDGIVEAFKKVGGAFVWVYDTFIKPVVDIIVGGIKVIIEVLQWLWNQIEKVGKFFADTFGWIADIIGGVGKFFGGILGGVGKIFGFQEGGVVSQPTVSLLGERGAEAVIPLKNGAVPVSLIGGGLGGGDQNTFQIIIQAGKLPQEETPESLTQKMLDGLIQSKMLGKTGQVA